MATSQQLETILNALDSTQLTVIAALASLMLILLIYLGFKRRKRGNTVSVAGTQKNRRDSDLETRLAESQARISDRIKVSDLESAQASALVGTETPFAKQSDILAHSVYSTTDLPQIPQDSVLRRHYLANEAAKQAALHEPYPTDAVLRRHYDTAHKIGMDQGLSLKEHARADSSLKHSVTAQESAKKIPEDSVLRRHYLANEAAKETALHQPYPADSVLQRHYDASHKLLPESTAHLGAEAASACRTEAKGVSQKASIIEQAIGKTSTFSSVATAKSVAEQMARRMVVPQDAVLKRHFISQLRAEIEASMAAKPTDSVLRRHYDGLVAAELERRLLG